MQLKSNLIKAINNKPDLAIPERNNKVIQTGQHGILVISHGILQLVQGMEQSSHHNNDFQTCVYPRQEPQDQKYHNNLYQPRTHEEH